MLCRIPIRRYGVLHVLLMHLTVELVLSAALLLAERL